MIINRTAKQNKPRPPRKRRRRIRKNQAQYKSPPPVNEYSGEEWPPNGLKELSEEHLEIEKYAFYVPNKNLEILKDEMADWAWEELLKLEKQHEKRKMNGHSSSFVIFKKVISTMKSINIKDNNITIDSEEQADFALQITTPVQALDLYKQVLTDRLNGIVKHVLSGLEALDCKFEGLLHDGHLIVMAGRPAMGKSALGQQVAEFIGKDKSVCFFNLEMAPEELVERSLARRAGVNLTKLRNHPCDMRHDENKRLSAASADYAVSNSFIISEKNQINEMVEHARRMKQWLTNNEQHPPLGAIFIDYLQLISGGEGGNKTAQVGDVSRQLKRLAQELEIPVILLCQLSRNCESRADKHPIASDLRDSGEIEQNADSIIFLYRDEIYNPDDPLWKGIAELIVSKNRHGATGVGFVKWKGEHLLFSDLDNDARDVIVA